MGLVESARFFDNRGFGFAKAMQGRLRSVTAASQQKGRKRASLSGKGEAMGAIYMFLRNEPTVLRGNFRCKQ